MDEGDNGRRVGDAGSITRRALLAGAIDLAILPQPRRSNVVVFGDSVSDGLWYGLRDTSAKSKRLNFVRRGKSSTGFAVPSFFDWPEQAKDIAAQGFSAGIMLLGLNDHLPVKRGKAWVKFGTADWRDIYGERATRVTRCFSLADVPLCWVGPPAVRPKTMDSAMLAIHNVLADVVPKAGGVYIPLRNFTLSGNSAYSDFMQVSETKKVRVRDEDGVHFSNAGYVLIAQYVLETARKHGSLAQVLG